MTTTRDLAFIGCRMLAVYLFWGAVITFATFFVPALTRFDLVAWGSGLYIAFLTVFSIAFVTLPSIALWFGANWLSQRMTRDISEVRQNTNWTVKKVLALLIIALGVYVLVFSISGLGHAIFWISIDSEDMKPIHYANVFQSVLLIGMGVGCIFGAKKIAKLVLKAAR